jgi:hypothetical protein
VWRWDRSFLFCLTKKIFVFCISSDIYLIPLRSSSFSRSRPCSAAFSKISILFLSTAGAQRAYSGGGPIAIGPYKDAQRASFVAVSVFKNLTPLGRYGWGLKLFIGEILMNSGKNVIFGIVDCPIENRFTGVGSPSAVARHGKRLSNRQRRLLDSLPGYDSRVTVKKGDVSMTDLAALTAKENVEFAMFTRGPERLIVRGDRDSVKINRFDAARLSARGYKWSGHTHIGDWLMESEGDMIILRQFNQRSSVIYNSFGEHNLFYPY